MGLVVIKFDELGVGQPAHPNLGAGERINPADAFAKQHLGESGIREADDNGAQLFNRLHRKTLRRVGILGAQCGKLRGGELVRGLHRLAGCAVHVLDCADSFLTCKLFFADKLRKFQSRSNAQ